MTIDRRFCGPPNSGNGGYVCGLLARHVGSGAEVTLRHPPPLDTPLDIHNDDGGSVTLRDGDTVLAEARPLTANLDAPPFVSFAEAEKASQRPSIAADEHMLPRCFVCGPDRARGDGMRLFAGPIDGREDLLAVPWIPDASLPHDDGALRAEIIWAALDCPSGYAAYAAAPEAMLLGRMAGRVAAPPRLGEHCVVSARLAGREGRKILVDCALYSGDGRQLAVTRNTWIVVPPEVQLGAT